MNILPQKMYVLCCIVCTNIEMSLKKKKVFMKKGKKMKIYNVIYIKCFLMQYLYINSFDYFFSFFSLLTSSLIRYISKTVKNENDHHKKTVCACLSVVFIRK